MIDVNEAIRLAKNARQTAQMQRAWYDTFWSMAMTYAFGPQWGYVNQSSTSNELRFLRSVVDPNREDVRVSINRIHPDIVRTAAALNPKQIIFDLEPASVSSRVVKLVGEKRLARHLKDIRAINVLRDKNLARLVFGSSIVRRTLQAHGAPMPVQGDLSMRSIRPGLSLVGCHEIIRDPSAQSLRWNEEESIMGQEKPMSVQDVKRVFGVELKTEATMGQLSDYNKQLLTAAGANGRFLFDSKLPAIVVYEWYFRDPEAPPELQAKTDGWPWRLWAYTDVASDRGEMQPLGEKPEMAFGPNPFSGNPFTGYHYDRQPFSPWGRGMPHLQIPAQDVFNLSLTWYVRMMMQGSGRWLIEENTIPPNEMNRMLSPDLRKPIVWKRLTNATMKPERSTPPQVNQAAAELLNRMPEFVRDSVNLNDVQFGDVSKRGESAKAIQSRLSEANAPIEAIREEDDDATANLLLGLVYDLGRNERLDEIEAKLGSSCSRSQVLEYLREPIEKHIVAVNIHPAVHRPKTPGEVRTDYLEMAQQQLMEPKKAIWNMMLRGVIMDDDMHAAYQSQMAELRSIVAGEQAVVDMTDLHEYHIWAVKRYTNDPAFKDLDPNVQEAVQQHYAEHMQAMIVEAQGLQMAASPDPLANRASPPSGAADGQGELVGAAAPGMN
ncbi:MAG TPA: hypothetical protein PK373_02050 [Sedimentisphaerales bacterium]|nr:hypothetical protein [Sedimentisphaerales bacterium]